MLCGFGNQYQRLGTLQNFQSFLRGYENIFSARQERRSHAKICVLPHHDLHARPGEGQGSQPTNRSDCKRHISTATCHIEIVYDMSFPSRPAAVYDMCIYITIHIHTHTHIRPSIHPSIHPPMHACMHTCMHTYVLKPQCSGYAGYLKAHICHTKSLASSSRRPPRCFPFPYSQSSLTTSFDYKSQGAA